MQTIQCSNCGADITGRYCSNCGEQAYIKRYQVKTIFNEFTHGIFHWENSLLKTFKRLFFQPGNFVREYISGKRKSYIKPFSYFLFLQTVFVLIFHFTGDKLFAFMNVTLNYDPSAFDKAAMLQNEIKKNLNYLNFIIPVFYAFFFKMFFKKKTGVNYAESFVAALYWFGTSMVISMAIMLLVFIDPRLFSLRFPAGFIFLSYATIQFVGRNKVKTFFKSSLVLLLTYTALIIVTAGLSILYVKFILKI